MKNINQMMKQAQLFQEKMAEMQEKLNQTEMSGSSGGGMVQATINGKHEFKFLKIDPALLNPEECEVLEDLIIAAYNDAKKKIDVHNATEMEKTTGAFNLPNGMKLPF